MAKRGGGRTTARPKVVTRHGSYRFQTGMVTATLLERGVPMQQAYDASKRIRDSLAGRETISGADLEAAMDAIVEELGTGRKLIPADNPTGLRVRLAEGEVPFARHVLIRDLVAVGLDVQEAATLTGDIERELRHEGSVVERPVLVAAVAGTLTREEDEAFARRYRLIEFVRGADRPIVVMIGGATGTGKSTLSMELAFRLGIRRVVSTDMIRETMRTVLSADVVPGLHDHSFRGMLQGGQVLSDPRERVLAGFRQQVSQVTVGVRAVIRRALRENAHLVVEGTHMVPPFASYMSDDLPAQGVGLLLAVTQEDRHRARFPRRAADQHLRDAAAYLDSFQSVRWIHDDLLAAAEQAGSLVLGSENQDRTTLAAMDYLSHALPATDQAATLALHTTAHADRRTPRTLFVILDGLPDHPHPLLGDRTPLAAAHTPSLALLAGMGGQGQIVTAPEGEVPHTDNGLWALLGAAPPDRRIGRGIFEAVGKGIPLSPGAIVFRGNLATQGPGGELIDRRAGRIREGVDDLLADLRDIRLASGIRANIYPAHEHRVVLMLRGAGLSPAVCDTDPGSATPMQRPHTPRPTARTPEAERTAAALRELLQVAEDHLARHPVNVERTSRGLRAANCIVTRGAASTTDLPKPNPHLAAGAVVAGCPTALGVGRLIGMQGITGPGMTANLDTDIQAKFNVAAALLQDRPLVVVHFKGTDIAGHERRPLAKRDYISAFDAALGRFLRENPDATQGLRVVVSSDHGTSSLTGSHIHDPVPVLVATWRHDHEGFEESRFDEESAGGGALGVLTAGELSTMLWAR